MKCSISLLALVGCVVSVAAKQDDFNIRFTRYSNADCTSPIKTHKLDNNNCKTPKWSDKGFLSYKFEPKSPGDDNGTGCSVMVYSYTDCKGKPFSIGAPEETYGKCAKVPFPNGARSIEVWCDGNHEGDHDVSGQD